MGFQKIVQIAGAAALAMGLSACNGEDAPPPADPVVARGTQGTLAVVGKAASANFILQFEVGPGGSGGRASGGGFQLTASIPEGR